MMGTCWEHIATKKTKSTPPPFPKLEKEKTKCLEPFHWLHEIFILKMIFHHFQFGLIPSF
jgi:hypothetical protein